MSIACRVKTFGRTDVTFPIAYPFFSCTMCTESRRVKDANAVSETRTRWNQIVTMPKCNAVSTDVRIELHAPVTLPFWKMFSHIDGKIVWLQGSSNDNYGPEIFALLSCYAESIGSWLPTFRYILSVSSSMAKQFKESLGLFDP
jgi:hypothetical protein